MSIGRTIVQLRLARHLTQRGLSTSSGLAVSYLSRLENGHVAPNVRTLSRIAGGLGVPVQTLFSAPAMLEAADRCPVSLSGRCILDQRFTGRGRPPMPDVEAYSSQQLEALRLCNLILHSQDHKLLQALVTMLQSLLALSTEQAARPVRRALR